jgi:hypothetical protein
MRIGIGLFAEEVYSDCKTTSGDQPETANLLRKHGGKTGEELKAEGK